MIIDALTFFEELDVLEFRLKLLWDVVDKFVIVEVDHTHSGVRKPFNFSLNRPRFDWAKEKIIYHVDYINMSGLNLSYKPDQYDPNAPQWEIENRQRNLIIGACFGFSDDDILMVSDCDEIPSREVVEFRKNNPIIHPMSCQQQVSVFSLDYLCPIDWRGTTISTLKYARENSPQTMRDMRNRYSVMPKAGWHLTYFGGASQVKRKIQSFAHQEYNKEEYLDMKKIETAVKTGGAIFPDGTPTVKIGKEYYPEYFLKLAPEKWWNHESV